MLDFEVSFCKRGVLSYGNSIKSMLWSSQVVVMLGNAMEIKQKDWLLIGCEKLDKTIHVSDSRSTSVKMYIIYHQY
jgi:hypothetical protein